MLLVNKYGEKNDDGELNKNEDGTVPLVDAEGFQKEFNELLEIEQKYKFKKIKLPEDVEISVNDLMLLEDILEIG